MEPPKSFPSKDQEVRYWKELAEKYKQELDETKEELEEFQVSSHELEKELETQLQHEEKKSKELTAANSRLQNECDQLREKLQKLQSDSHKRVVELEDNFAKVDGHKKELQKYIRELEQDNDDLERAKRATIVSLEDFEQRLNQALERNVLLESELDEKGQLLDTVQRLKDEARDLKQEIGVRKHQEIVLKTSGDSLPGVTALPMQDSGYAAQGNTPTTPTTPLGKAPLTPSLANGGTPSTPLTASARISALNIVGDLLRKVGISSRFRRANADTASSEDLGSRPRSNSSALESKLATCRNFVKDEPRSKPVTNPSNSPRKGRKK